MAALLSCVRWASFSARTRFRQRPKSDRLGPESVIGLGWNMHAADPKETFAYTEPLSQLLQQRFRLLQVFGVKAFSEPVVNLGE
jgi:hypothetical protein